ncbi:hypothetical protein [Streptomyces sp. 2A115]|uniref:hypothetical protein n=1 Tax=Streptomyces sp. 2A115 TaxID=3457439 RepID=UPI003FCF12AA
MAASTVPIEALTRAEPPARQNHLRGDNITAANAPLIEAESRITLATSGAAGYSPPSMATAAPVSV